MLKKCLSADSKQVIYKSRDTNKIGTITKTQPANKMDEIEGERILPANEQGQKKTVQFPKRMKTGSKTVQKLNTDYSKKDDESGKVRKDPV
jgi:hypothetical protein